MRIATYIFAALALLSTSLLHAQAPATQPAENIGRTEFNAETYDFKKSERLAPRFRSFYVTWGTTDKPEFKKFIQTVKPAVVQAGWYGPMFHGYVDLKPATGYPMQLPVSGLEACWEQWKNLHALVKANGGKTVAHFTVTNVIKGPEKDELKNPGNFADWYTYTWPVKLLGIKPSPSYLDLLSKDSTGTPLVRPHYVQYHGLCINNPSVRKMLISMLRAAIDNGVDGVITLYNYRWDCSCQHCQDSFKLYLKENYTPEELKTHFKIDNLQATKFDYIPGQTPGYPSEKDLTPFGLASYQWSAIAYKQAWNEVFIDNGRAKKPDLILAQWDHIGNVGVTEERSFLPASMWAKGENYLWYSGNHYIPDKDLLQRIADKKIDLDFIDNDGWLNGLYIRALAGDKPYAIGRYDSVRTRAGLSETMALGGAGTGLYNNITDPASFAVLDQYSKFAQTHENDILDTHIRVRPFFGSVQATPKGTPDTTHFSQPAMLADTCVIIPRQSAWAGRKQSFDTFRKIATGLVRRQRPILFCSDELLNFAPTPYAADPTHFDDKNLTRPELRANGALNQYQTLILPEALALTDTQIKALESFLASRPDRKIVIIGAMAILDNHDRPWAIAQPADASTRLAKLLSYKSQVVQIPLESLATLDYSLLNSLPFDASKPSAPKPATFELYTQSSDGQRTRLSDPNALRVAIYVHPNARHVLHIVNYKRDIAQAAAAKKPTPDAEFPIPSAPLWVKIPASSAIKTDSFFSADKSRPHLFTPDTQPDGSPQPTDITAEKDASGDTWIKIGPVTIYRILELY
jgi:hypothetical protein